MSISRLPEELPSVLKKAHLTRDYRLVSELLDKHSLVDVEDHTFFNNLNEKSNVLDLGAWKGNFAQKMVEQFGCCVDVFEPNRNQIKILQEKFENSDRVAVYPYAVGGENASVTFYPSPDDYPGNEKGSSLMTSSPYVDESFKYVVEKKRLADISEFTKNESYDLIKMDIEGAELEVFNDPKSVEFLCRSSMLSIEFHYKMPINDQVLITEQEINNMIRKLADAGFTYVDFGRNFRFIDCLFYK
ncbi:MAG: FkbM family methyltransferase [Aestuariibacter sp.]